MVSLWEKSEKPKFHLAAVIDITANKIAEQNLKESQELFRRMITNAPISIFATDEKGIFTLYEGKAVERVGMKTGENVGVSAYDLFSDIKLAEHDNSTIKYILNIKSYFMSQCFRLSISFRLFLICEFVTWQCMCLFEDTGLLRPSPEFN